MAPPTQPKTRPRVRRRGGRRPGSGRQLDPLTRTLAVPVDPADGIKDELLAVSKQLSVPAQSVAWAVLMFCRGRYAIIAQRMNVQPLLVGDAPATPPNNAPAPANPPR